MKYAKLLTASLGLFISTSYSQIIIDHTCTKIDLIPTEAITEAKASLHIAYGHSSHGSQLVTGMDGLISFKGDLFDFNSGGTNGALDLRDTPFTGYADFDLGNPDLTAWAGATRTYLDAHSEVNVIIWAWCGQLGSMNASEVTVYLNQMSALENEYPAVKFVYMTGHLNGSGLEGELHKNNEQIRLFCAENQKILYDFADIETYDPDGKYFGNWHPNDNCDYDEDDDYTYEGNWAIEWQNTHPGEWYQCESAHSQPLNANLKAYAAWWLWARLAGWTAESTAITDSESDIPQTCSLSQNFPNPFNPKTSINYELPIANYVDLSVYNILGQKVATLVSENQHSGSHRVEWDAAGFASGVYYYHLKVGEFQEFKKMILLQ